MKGEILKLLKETDGYISGQELCEKFGVSRTAIWKVINQLKVRSIRSGQERMSYSLRRQSPQTTRSGALRNRARPTGLWQLRNSSLEERGDGAVSGHPLRESGSG